VRHVISTTEFDVAICSVTTTRSKTLRRRNSRWMTWIRKIQRIFSLTGKQFILQVTQEKHVVSCKYRCIGFIFSNPTGAGFCRIWNDIRSEPELDFQIDCNFTNLMCKTLRMYE